MKNGFFPVLSGDFVPRLKYMLFFCEIGLEETFGTRT